MRRGGSPCGVAGADFDAARGAALDLDMGAQVAVKDEDVGTNIRAQVQNCRNGQLQKVP